MFPNKFQINSVIKANNEFYNKLSEKDKRIKELEDVLKWYAANHRPEDYLNDAGEKARKVLKNNEKK